ncbi:MAG: citrate/2-methylcitrate synthase, partial [Planctomycetota bacterium]
ASTLSDVYSAVSGAIGALRGPLHGGANQAVTRILQGFESVEDAEQFVRDSLAAKKKIMGFGHRVYKTEDPRAAILRQWCKQLGEETDQPHWAEMQAAMEKVMLDEKGIHCNVDFYSATVYHMLGIPSDLFTPIFAVARVVGWTAHMLEQYAHNRIFRPLCEYVGEHDLTVPPLDER